MQLQPIIRAKVNKFRTMYELESAKDGIVFERFANQTILKNHQPSGFSVDDDLLDAICVGGFDDMGLDGICIKVNGVLVRSLEEVNDIIAIHKSAEVEFIFVQSKYKVKFDSGEFGKFINGATDFLGESHYQPMNEQVKKWLKIKDYLLSDEIMVLWKENPRIRLYYVVMGTWNNSPHIEAITRKFKDDITILNTYGEIFVNYVDSEKFKKICDDNDNLFTTVVNVIDTFSLTAVNNVENSSIILCSAVELMNMLITEDGIIRKGLFNDNVRDYQGETAINDDIYKTIETEPECFVLVNNGVTIICNEIISGNRKITIKNPQIVNGCQTCSILFRAYRNGVDISKVVISAKIISTESDEITNKIVRGTNRQNIVYDEAFEITREFHKQLEELFEVLVEEDGNDKIYYERRSRQYADNPTIKASQKVNFRMLIQSFISVFLNEPHKGHRHESKLLQEYKNKIFVDTQSKYTYYIAALIYVKLEVSLKKNPKLIKMKTYKAHIAMLIRELTGGKNFDINNEKNIDKYCEKMHSELREQEKFDQLVNKASTIFEDATNQWIKKKGAEHKYGIKDSYEFTRFLVGFISESENKEIKYRGTVTKISIDRYGNYFGYISKSPLDVFFHSKENLDLNFGDLLNQNVLYDIKIDEVSGREKAINIQVLN